MLPVLRLFGLPFHDTEIQVLQNVCVFIFVYRTKSFFLPHQLQQWYDYCSE